MPRRSNQKRRKPSKKQRKRARARHRREELNNKARRRPQTVDYDEMPNSVLAKNEPVSTEPRFVKWWDD